MTRVFVVDDNPVNLRVCRLILERFGYAVSTETDPLVAFATLMQELPDVLITDLMMPGMDGIELTRRTRALPDAARLPIIVLTARGEDADQSAAMAAGANAYLTKPVSSGTLSSAVVAALMTGGQ